MTSPSPSTVIGDYPSPSAGKTEVMDVYARDLLGFPDDHEAPMGVGIGHPAPPKEKRESSPRIPLEELVDWGRWEA